MRKIILGTIIVAVFASLANGQDASASARKAIEANLKAFVDAFNKGDAATVAAIYATDARLLPPNAAMVEGRANIQSFWGGAIGAGVKLVSLTAIDVNVSGNHAIETGNYVSTVSATGGGTTTDEGKYVVVWRREGRDWRIIRDIWNSNKPQQ